MEYDQLVDFFSKCDVTTLIGIAIGIFYIRSSFKSEIKQLKTELKNEISSVRTELKEEIKEMKSEIKEIRNQNYEIGCRVFSIEGILHAKDCCMIKDDRQMKKAE